MNGWTLLADKQMDQLWDKFYKEFHFKPSTTIFPSFSTPHPFIKFDITNLYDEASIRDLEDKSVQAFQECTQPGELIYALDWQHDCYLVDARLEFPRYSPWRPVNKDWMISIYPDGDYHFFLARDFSWGLLGHPWEQTITVFGEKFLECLLIQNPLILQAGHYLS